MNQNELFHRWVTGKVTEPAVVGTIHAVPHRLHYGEGLSSLALRYNDMVLVSAVTRTGSIPRNVITQQRRKLYQQLRAFSVEFNHALDMPGVRRSGIPAPFSVTRTHIEALIDGRPGEPYWVHESYGHALRVREDHRILLRYLFVCKMIGVAPIYETISEMVEWHRCVSLLSPQQTQH